MASPYSGDVHVLLRRAWLGWVWLVNRTSGIRRFYFIVLLALLAWTLFLMFGAAGWWLLATM